MLIFQNVMYMKWTENYVLDTCTENEQTVI